MRQLLPLLFVLATAAAAIAVGTAATPQAGRTPPEPDRLAGPSIGACCLPDGTCVDPATEAQCALLGGEYQGDLVFCDDPAVDCTQDDDPDDHGPIPTSFSADLLGENEVPPVITDTSGAFAIEFEDDFSRARFRLTIHEGLRITQVHLHCGPDDVNGGIIAYLIGLDVNSWDVDGRWIDNAFITEANIVNDVCGDTLRDLAIEMANGNMYINVHTLAHASGEVRGQIMADDDDSDSSSGSASDSDSGSDDSEEDS